jgi:hypothetical protein
MTTLFAALVETQWPIMLAAHGESVTYTDADDDDVSVNAIITPRVEKNELDVTWDVQARQVEILIAADDLEGITFTPRVDTITARGVDYTITERVDHDGVIYRFLCERADLVNVQHRGRVR